MKLINRLKKVFWLVAIPFLVLIWPYLQTGVPYTHDGENHLARFANYKVAVREGQIPPRFAPNLMNHYGYPVFNYNYPLANLLSLPLSILGVSYELTFKLLMVIGLGLAVAGALAWLKLLELPFKTSWLGAGTLLTAPYTASLVYVRGNVGEVWAMGMFVWALWFTKSLELKKPVSWLVSVSIILGFLLAHNIAAFFGGLLWLVYCWRSFKRNKKLWLAWFKPTLLAGLLSLWFWLPAIMEKNLVVLDGASLSLGATNHLIQPQQLFASPLQFGFSYLTAVDTLSFSLGLVPLFSLVASSLWLIKFGRRQKKLARQVAFLSLSGWLLLFLQTPLAYSIWKTVPLAGFIQFPWRLTLFWLIFTLPLVAFSWQLGRGFKLMIGFFLLLQILTVWRLEPADRLHKTNLDYDLFSQSTSTLNENLPRDFTFSEIADWSPEPRILSGQADYDVEHWTGSSRRYKLVVSETALVAEPTMSFAGWQTTANGQLVEYTNNDTIQGRLAYQLSPGEYQITTRFTQRTWPRLVGNSLSGLALIVWGILIWQEKRKIFGKSSN
jgi:hypothetical protein